MYIIRHFDTCCAGNGLSGSGVSTIVAASQYAPDTIHLQNLVLDKYESIKPKPLILAPGGSCNAL